jgi:putative spermidine/putrescine transport system ATP-binding protein
MNVFSASIARVSRSRPRRAGDNPNRDRPFVEFERVQKSYDGVRLAVDNLDLAIEEGEFITFLGPSGSGKTTSLMMLAGFETPTAGDIRIGGRSVAHVPPFLRNIGIVFQNYALFPHMTVARNIAFPLAVRRTPRSVIDDRVTRVLDLVRLGGFADRRPAELSGGQQQRVALARALVFDPDLVLMDEPLGSLDKQLREQLQIEIKHIQHDLGVTVVYVTHDQSEALTMSDRIAVFRDGVVQQLATPADLYERPANAFVAQFIGESNCITGTVRSVGADECVVEVAGGAVVRARRIGGAAPGTRTMLSIRPERVILEPANDCDNIFDATVEELIYHGDHIKLRLCLLEATEFRIKVPNIGGSRAFARDERISVGWRRNDCCALDAPEEPPRAAGAKPAQSRAKPAPSRAG